MPLAAARHAATDGSEDGPATAGAAPFQPAPTPSAHEQCQAGAAGRGAKVASERRKRPGDPAERLQDEENGMSGPAGQGSADGTGVQGSQGSGSVVQGSGGAAAVGATHEAAQKGPGGSSDDINSGGKRDKIAGQKTGQGKRGEGSSVAPMPPKLFSGQRPRLVGRRRAGAPRTSSQTGAAGAERISGAAGSAGGSVGGSGRSSSSGSGGSCSGGDLQTGTDTSASAGVAQGDCSSWDTGRTEGASGATVADAEHAAEKDQGAAATQGATGSPESSSCAPEGPAGPAGESPSFPGPSPRLPVPLPVPFSLPPKRRRVAPEPGTLCPRPQFVGATPLHLAAAHGHAAVAEALMRSPGCDPAARTQQVGPASTECVLEHIREGSGRHVSFRTGKLANVFRSCNV